MLLSRSACFRLGFSLGLGAILSIVALAVEQQQGTREVEQHIQHIEDGILPPIVVPLRPPNLRIVWPRCTFPA